MHFSLPLCLLIHQALFCSCLPPQPIDDTQYSQYNLIAEGKIKKVVAKDLERIIFFKVNTFYKGQSKQRTIIIHTPLTEGACGISPKKGEAWLMFAFAEGAYYRTQLCTRTKNMNDQAWNYHKEELAADIKFLEEKKAAGKRLR